MPKTIKVGDQPNLVPTSRFPHAHFPFDNFNVVQSRLIEFYEEDANVIVAASTSAGKTVVSEMMLSHEAAVRRGKGIFLSPLKSLSQEKYDDWTDSTHHFGSKKVAICTGDFTLTPARRAELAVADVIIMSSEMLNSKTRNTAAEKTTFLSNVGTCVVDEAHLITVAGRGDHLESGLVKYATLNPQGRVVLLSATVPNAEEIADWLCRLTNKDTYLLESKYRPCPLGLHYEHYDDSGYSYDDREMAKVWGAIRIVESYPDDKFLIFAHTKRTGEMMKKALVKSGVECEFHNASLDKKKRQEVERRFREDKAFRILVATSTLAWGINSPARRVIILGVHRGLSEVEKYDIDQEAGRAGRPKYDPAGDAYILVPEGDAENQIARLKKPFRIRSQMYDETDPKHLKVLGFHLVSEIHQGGVATRDDVFAWYSKTLAAHQARKLPAQVVDDVLGGLVRCGAIGCEDGRYFVTGVGKIASLFYYSPWDVSDLSRNMTKLFKAGKEDDDIWLAYALGNIDTNRWNIVSSAERDQILAFESNLNRSKCRDGLGTYATGGSIKAAYCYHSMLRGASDAVLAGQIVGLKTDAGRLREVLLALDVMACRWGRRDWLKGLHSRLMYGVEAELLGLVGIAGIGRAKAQRLFDHGLTTPAKVAAGRDTIILALSCTPKMADKIVAAAKEAAAAQVEIP